MRQSGLQGTSLPLLHRIIASFEFLVWSHPCVSTTKALEPSAWRHLNRGKWNKNWLSFYRIVTARRWIYLLFFTFIMLIKIWNCRATNVVSENQILSSKINFQLGHIVILSQPWFFLSIYHFNVLQLIILNDLMICILSNNNMQYSEYKIDRIRIAF